MPNYEKMYLSLFNAITNALKKLENQNYGDAAELLRKSQQTAEHFYITAKDEE